MNLTGPLSRLTVFGQPLIIVNDRETAAQLFEKSAKHSSKPDSVFADELYERLCLFSIFHYVIMVLSRLIPHF